MYKQYTNNEIILGLPTEYLLPKNHIARVISRFVDSIPEKELYPKDNSLGRPEYSPAMLLKILLFAYMRRTFSGRRIQQMAEENIPMKWLIGDMDLVPSYRTINRFRTSPAMKILIKKAFGRFRQILLDNSLITDDAIFIDGTKIQADANKYSFVWRKSSEKFEAKLDETLAEFYPELIQSKVDAAIEVEDTVERLEKIDSNLNQEIKDLDKTIDHEIIRPGGSPAKKRRRMLKHLRHRIETDFLPRKHRYVQNDHTFGDRNSFSKTDHDATFMRMKEDPMQNGQLKPGYNLQIGTQKQFTLYYDVFQRPTDQRTLQPFVDKINFSQTPFKYIVADAGYGSESNYTYLEKHHEMALIPYTMYEKELSRKYQRDKSKLQNWRFDESNNCYIDNHDIRFSFKGFSRRVDKQGFVRHFKNYEADIYDDPEHYYYSTTKSGYQRRISINSNWERQKQQMKDQLSSAEGAEIFSQRKIEPETVFGHLKARLAFNRLSVRGMDQVKCELGIILMAGNIEKLVARMTNCFVRVQKIEQFFKITEELLVFFLEPRLMSQFLLIF